MPKKAWLALAILWTAVIATLCLVSFNALPGSKIPDADKYVHATLHFVFVLLWSQYAIKAGSLREWRMLAAVISLSILYGCLIEVAQEYFTTTRQADLKDVFANFVGAIAASVLQLAFSRTVKRTAQ